MKRNIPAWSGVAAALAVAMWLLSVPAAAQSHGSSGGSSSSGSGATSSSGGGGPRSHAGYRGDGRTRSAGDLVPPYARPRGDRPVTGEAVPRVGAAPVPGGRGNGGVYLPNGYYGGYYPYGYGGLGFGSYYGY